MKAIFRQKRAASPESRFLHFSLYAIQSHPSLSRLKFTDATALKFVLITTFITICVSSSLFFVRCDNMPLAGLEEHPYPLALQPKSKGAACNTECGCKGTDLELEMNEGLSNATPSSDANATIETFVDCTVEVIQ